MEDSNQEARRRVSFATEPQINYIYQKDNSTSMTSICSAEIPMDITTELAEFKNLNLFTTEESSREGADDEAEQDFRYLSQKRMSLDPLKYTNKEIFPDVVAPENTSNISNYGELAQDNEIKPQSIFWRSSLKNEPRKSLNASFEDTGTVNSSFGVEELVNTIDLRRIIPQEWQEKTSVGEFLASKGIRFLDDAVISTMKRDTLSKSRNTVDPLLLVYYKYSLAERIEFLYNFSSFLIDKMRDLQREIDDVEQAIDVSTVNKDNLKRIRNDARNKSKIDWYSLRKIYEIQFNKKMVENKSKVIEILDGLKRDNTKTIDGIGLKEKNVEKLRCKIAELNEKVYKFDKENIEKTEKLRAMIEERKKVYESAREDLESVSHEFEARKMEEVVVQKRIDRLNNEIGNLKKNIAIKNVNETQLDEIKSLLERYETIFHFKVVKITGHSLVFEIGGNVILLELNGSLEVSTVSFVKSDGDPFSEFARALVQSLNVPKLLEFVQKCLDTFYTCYAVRKEVNSMKERVKIECFYLNSALYLRVHVSELRTLIDLTITNSLDLICDNQVYCNIKSDPGSLSTFILGRIVK